MSATAVVCRELVELVTGYLEGSLTPARRDAVEAHLLGCDNCSEYVEQMRAVIAVQAAGANPASPQESDLPPGMLDGLLAAFRARGTSSR